MKAMYVISSCNEYGMGVTNEYYDTYSEAFDVWCKDMVNVRSGEKLTLTKIWSDKEGSSFSENIFCLYCSKYLESVKGGGLDENTNYGH